MHLDIETFNEQLLQGFLPLAVVGNALAVNLTLHIESVLIEPWRPARDLPLLQAECVLHQILQVRIGRPKEPSIAAERPRAALAWIAGLHGRDFKRRRSIRSHWHRSGGRRILGLGGNRTVLRGCGRARCRHCDGYGKIHGCKPHCALHKDQPIIIPAIPSAKRPTPRP
jgi:hypothetical protein